MVLVLAGPNSRKVLSRLTDHDISNSNFPWLKGKEIIISDVKVKALRINYLGELGWELHHSGKWKYGPDHGRERRCPWF